MASTSASPPEAATASAAGAAAAAAERPAPLGSMAPERLAASLTAVGIRPTAARQAMQRLSQRVLVSDGDFAENTALLPRAVRERIGAVCLPPPRLQVADAARAGDGTVKLAIALEDAAEIETVIIPIDRAHGEAHAGVASPTSDRDSARGTSRVTVCVSSQVGCARRCAFCATGSMGWRRNLGAAEIVGQVRAARAWWRTHEPSAPAIRNIVFMGMGEPLDNVDAVADAVEVLTSDLAFGFAAGRITVSTVGAPGLESRLRQLFARTKVHLALSLHAPDDARRATLMPVHRHQSLAAVKQAIERTLPPGRDVLVAYILLDGFNDAPADAALLAAWLHGLPARVNLIPANPGPDARLVAPPVAGVLAFQRELAERGVRALVRWPHGREVGGACGQLVRRRGGSR